MKAVLYRKYGSPDVLKLKEVQKPIPNDDEVLVKVHAVSINPLDWRKMRGKPFLVRLSDGFLKPKNNILGADIAGQVEMVGRNVKQFHLGDEVFGDISVGGLAEYACVTEDKLVSKPNNVSFEEAAAVPVAALTALQGLRNKGQIQSGQKVLINGASGGVGTFAVQIAKVFEAEVTGVCSTRNLEMVRSIGADDVIDYTKEDFTQNGQLYDLIIDAVGNCSISGYKRALSPKGICVVIGFSTLGHMFQVMLLGSWVSKTGGKKIGPMLATANQKDLMFIKELLETGKVASIIDRRYSLSEASEAIGYLEEGHARGKVIIVLE